MKILKKTNIMAEFVITGKDYIPDVVTKRLNIKPTRSFIKGDTIKGKPTKRTFSLWKICTEYEETRDIDYQLVKIYDLLKDKIKVLNDMRKQYDLVYTIGIVIYIENKEQPTMHFADWLIDFAHTTKAEIDIDLYVS